MTPPYLRVILREYPAVQKKLVTMLWQSRAMVAATAAVSCSERLPANGSQRPGPTPMRALKASPVTAMTGSRFFGGITFRI